ncbi:NitT/TauT family transport system substrate-binding protein [Acetoanaerobium pronyense]|uniref:NitT/TauT family transport system substrate-binding protein n=1 Tax=Acetoanaerobium pronyense TaxID=1482736 RepID=A0ABS4KEP3_9FIRM|nr:ABC transporter substrate-binding protein [Acetoanaerobium pronyense]MBP2026229.1 NitT/TauT family transport system substrate-binding protein [Acetoanaerobium pronyense]
MKNSIKVVVLIIAMSIFMFSGCTVGNNTEVTESKTEEVSADMNLKIGVMPAVDAAPIFVAQEKGYFEQLGLDLEVELFTSGQDRQSALQTGQVDGAISDIIALLMNVQGGFDIKGTMLTDGMFPILVREGFEDKENISMALMEVSVTNYLADEWLSENHDIEKIFINEIPARLEMIKTGNVDMGVFPEPVATMGSLDRLEKIIYENKDGYCPDIFVFTEKAINEKEGAIKAFHEGYNMAVKDINEDDSLARELLIKKLSLIEDIKDMMDLPEYKIAQLPNDEYVSQIINWIEKELGKEISIEASDIFERKFIN